MSIRPRLPIAAFAFAALGLLTSSPASAAGDEEASGLSPGVLAPTFMLPVVNDYGAKRWGPGKWAGRGAEQPKKLVLMSFFATWCDPCKKEMPELVRLWGEYEEQGLGVMLVSIDKGKEQRDEVVKLAAEHKVPFPVLHDRFQVVARRYDAERLPYMLMVGPDGVIKRVHVGYTEELKASLENEIRAELGLELLPAEVATADDKPTKGKRKGRGKRGRK